MSRKFNLIFQCFIFCIFAAVCVEGDSCFDYSSYNYTACSGDCCSNYYDTSSSPCCTGLETVAIVGIVFGILVGMAVIVGIVYVLYNPKKRKARKNRVTVRTTTVPATTTVVHAPPQNQPMQPMHQHNMGPPQQPMYQPHMGPPPPMYQPNMGPPGPVPYPPPQQYPPPPQYDPAYPPKF